VRYECPLYGRERLATNFVGFEDRIELPFRSSGQVLHRGCLRERSFCKVLHTSSLRGGTVRLSLRGDSQIVAIGTAFSHFIKGRLGQLQLLTGKVIGRDVRDEHQSSEYRNGRVRPVGTITVHIILFTVGGGLVFASYWFGLLRGKWISGSVASSALARSDPGLLAKSDPPKRPFGAGQVGGLDAKDSPTTGSWVGYKDLARLRRG
jgi:hypothetical protein